MSSDTLDCGPVHVVWRADDALDAITYEKMPLGEAINERVTRLVATPYGVSFPQTFYDLIDDLLDSIAFLSPNEKRRKIFLADRIFEHLCAIDTDPPNPKVQSAIRANILLRVWEWEDTHETVHKGTIYYFMAATYLSLGDIPSAYICFFNALEDDKQNYPSIPKNLKDAPTYRTTSLIDNPHNVLHASVVVPLRTQLQSFINKYNRARGKNLTLGLLDQKLLQFDGLEDVKRFFVATFHEIFHLAPLNTTRMINNDYSKLKIIDTLFNLSLIIDQLLEYRFLTNAPRHDMANAIYQLALHLGWTTLADSGNAKQFLAKVQPNLNTCPPDRTVPDLLDGKARFATQSTNPDMQATFLTYHLRNFAGHNILGQDVLINRYREILDCVMDALFLAIEVL